jgi:ABC-2 type transport system permease protein
MRMPRGQAFLQLFLVRVREFYREPAVLLWAYAFPLFLAVGLGVAFSGNRSPLEGESGGASPSIEVADDQDPAEAHALTEELKRQGWTVHEGPASEVRRRLRADQSILLVIPGKRSYRYVYDPQVPGSMAARCKVDEVVQRWKGGERWPTTDETKTESGGRYIDFLIPGLMGLNLMAGGLWGVGFVVVDLRTRRLLKQLTATPMRKSDFLLAIVTSRLLLLVPEMLALALIGVIGFGMPFRGGIGTLFLLVLLGGAAFAGIGLLTASRIRRAESMTGLINLVMLPMWMLSGTFFPSDRFPKFLDPFIQVLPLTWLNEALRQVILEGRSFAAVQSSLWVLLAWAVGTFLLALLGFRWR